MRIKKRKSLLYKTGVEYGDYTINHIEGCSHGCKYPCYAFLLKKRWGKVKTYETWCKAALVPNALELLEKEIPKYRNKIKSVHLCFSSDPFMFGRRDIADVSIQIIKMLNDNGIPCTVLTKGILPIELAELSRENEYGITIVSLNGRFRTQWEPGSATFGKRIAALRELHERGCRTWVSIEPYPTPNIIEQDLTQILNAIGFVDKIIFGRMHYNKMVTAYKGYQQFYNEQADIVETFCRRYGKACHIKNGTRK